MYLLYRNMEQVLDLTGFCLKSIGWGKASVYVVSIENQFKYDIIR